jgi:protein phosphatase 1 regulatory subunit 11
LFFPTQSKVCCIYHKPRAFGESSDEDSSSDDSDDSDHDHNHDKNGHHCHNHKRPDKCYRNSPNAYERQPQYKSTKLLNKTLQ